MYDIESEEMNHKDWYNLAPGCPWADWTRPNVKWCEEYVCSYVVTPANTWSNLAYFVSAYGMHKYINGDSKRVVWLFVPATIVTGATSFAFHASVSRFLQLFDFFGMFTFCVLGVVLNLRRDHMIGQNSVWLTYVIGVLLCGLAIPIFELGLSLPIQATVLVLIIIQLSQEARLRLVRYRKHPQLKPPYRRFRYGMTCLGMAFLCSVADITRFWCEPTNHFIQGHALWHCLSALSLYFVFLFYCEMDFDGLGVGTLLG